MILFLISRNSRDVNIPTSERAAQRPVPCPLKSEPASERESLEL
jgi:hypothetical protein